MDGEQSRGAVVRPRRMRIALLTAAVLGSSAFAVWQVTVFLRRLHHRPPPVAGMEPARSPGPVDDVSMIDLALNPELLSGLRVVSAAPPVAPPDRARRLWARGWKDPATGQVQLTWAWRLAGHPQPVAAHVRHALENAGFAPFGEPEASHTQVYVRQRTIVAVTLHRPAQNGTIRAPKRTYEPSRKPEEHRNNSKLLFGTLQLIVTEIRPHRPGDFE